MSFIVRTLFALVLILPGITFAQSQSLSVTVTPPLIQLTIGPGESWSSTLKIVNANSYDVTYYATPVDFEANGEEGQGTFVPLVESGGMPAATLGNWVSISRDPITVPRGMSVDIPFTVSIPSDASPGGHYAAVLVGTRPGDLELTGPTVKVSSFVSSLLFVRIKGEIDERARIREFRSASSLYQEPKADFVLRFENIGNTHLRPQGEIVLYNMWGKERGRVVLSQKSNFGNVLPNSVRKFSFSWQGEKSIVDIGRYSAEVTLAYGEEGKQTTTAKTYFWVVPIIPVSITLSCILAFILLIAWLIRRYIRRALAIEGARIGVPIGAPQHAPSFGALFQPLQEVASDMGRITSSGEAHTTTFVAEPFTLFRFFQKYSLVFFFCFLLVAAGFAVWGYFETVLLPERAYEITEVSSEEETPANP